MHYIKRIATNATARTGFLRSLQLFICGGLCLLLFSPFDVWPLLFVLIPFLFIVLSAAPTARRAMWDGFSFGYGFFIFGTYWIAISLTVDSDKFAWLIPFSVFGLSALFALYFVLFSYCYHKLKSLSLIRNIFIFAVLWVVIEYLRSLGIFAFPWNLIGYSVASIPFLLQAASIVGIYGLSLLTMCMALAPLPLLLQPSKKYSRGMLTAVTACVIILCANALLTSPTPKSKKITRIRIVQPNIPQVLKWDNDHVQSIFRTLGALSQIESEAAKPDIIIWPETAVPFTLRADSEWQRYMAQWVPDSGVIITGAITEQNGGFRNALISLNRHAQRESEYAKRHLVPFGEFIPLRTVLPLEKIAPGPSDFARGTSNKALTLKNHPAFQPMICYESAFPWLAKSEGPRPDWLLTITNDAWFGDSPGPYQHFTMSRVRAVEQGLPIIRVGNTGISAAIDADGKVLRTLKLGEQGIIDVALPAPKTNTLYAHYGEMIPIGCILTIILLLWVYSKNNRKLIN